LLDVGSILGNKYRLLRLVGEGGMGAVYEAEHLALGSRAAVKVLHPELARRSGLVERFLQEARVAAQIRSPHVVRVTDVDRTPEGQAYIVMDLLVGEPLSTALQRQRRLPVPLACEFTTQILDALEAAHALGVIHRDLKPENVFITNEGGKPVLKLIDFGIAKAHRSEAERNLTVAGSLMGTAEYMAPEQARSAGAVDARADVYAAGVMLYEMIAGVRPVTGDDARAVAIKVERGDVAALLHVAPETPREIAGIVHHAMAPRAEMRFASAAAMRTALNEARGLAGIGSASTSQVPVPAPSERPVPTQRALPIAPALGPVLVSPSATAIPQAPSGAQEVRRGRGVLVALLIVGILGLVGAGGVLASQAGLFASNEPPAPLPTTVAPPVSAPAPAPAPSGARQAAPSTPAGLPPLLPTRPASPFGPAVRPLVPSADGGRAAPAPPGLFPTSLPGFPGAIPFPTALPSALPSGFPTALPSGFPAILPPWPAAPPAAPAAAASASGPTI
jgi:eukaryotic-like serine/threonine-protein kinase